MVADGYPLLGDLSKLYPNGYAVQVTAATGEVVQNDPERLTGLLRALIRGYRFMNQRYEETKEILTSAGYQLDKDMDAAPGEGKYQMFERIPPDGSVNEAGLELVIDEEKAAGKLPEAFWGSRHSYEPFRQRSRGVSESALRRRLRIRR
jgi:ABC-type nitrate/sulfonate/bicarbonate transport system substrate-binding protein